MEWGNQNRVQREGNDFSHWWKNININMGIGDGDEGQCLPSKLNEIKT